MTDVERITFVPFVPDGRCAAIVADNGAGLSLPTGDVLPGEDFVLDTVLRVPLEQAGFRYQRFHPFGQDAGHLLAWIEGDVYRGRRPHREAALAILPPEEVAARLAPDLGAMVRAAARSYRTQSDESYYADAVRTLERAYLRGTTPQEGSGFSGTPEQWRAQRESITTGLDRSGTFLDVGCANGLLMESARSWCAERGLDLEPYGVDLAPGLVELARRRLPHWSDRIWPGNAVDWASPDGWRFDFVHIGLGAVPSRRRAQLVGHHLDHTVAPGGRLLVSHYVAPGSTSDPSAHDCVVALGFTVAGGAGQTVWIDRR